MRDTSTGQLHVVVGAGSVGSAVSAELVRSGHRVRVVTRSGSGPVLPGVERVAADATDADGLGRLTAGATALYNCANPRYHRWAQDWPPVAAALLQAATHSGAVLATVSNLYVYGPVDGPMTEQTPIAATFVNGQVRAKMWQDALAAHAAGRVRVTEVRGSDYVGPHTQGQFAERAVPRLVRGKAVSVLGRPDAAHTYTYPGDVARLLVVAAADARAWGHAWHVPSNQPTTARAVVDGLCDAAAVARVPVRRIPPVAMSLAGLFSPELRPFADTRYQHDHPFVMDSSAAQTMFGLAPTRWQEVFSLTLAAHDPLRRSTKAAA
jgi:nucleoside-diphosphate-sugar epimerase